jgi:thiamine transport system permease protein
VAFLVVFFVYPLARIMIASFSGETGVVDAFADVFRTSSLRGAAWFTLWQAAVSTALTVVIAFPAASLVGRFEFRGRRAFLAALTVPFVMPTVVVGAAFLALLGPDGPLGIDLRRTVPAILIAHVFYNYAVVVRTVGGRWANLDPATTEAARMLGAGPWQAFRSITLPQLAPSIRAAASIVFLFTFTSFGVVLLLGGFGINTIEVLIFREATVNLDLAVAAALALLQLIGIVGALLAYRQRGPAIGQALRSSDTALVPVNRWMDRLFAGATLAISALLLAVPLGTLVARAVRVGDGLGFEHFRRLTSNDPQSIVRAPWRAVLTSLEIGLAATAISLIVGMLLALAIAHRPTRFALGMDTLVMLPLGTSAVTIGFGFLVAFDWPIDLRTSPVLIPIAHALIAVPFVVRTTLPVLRTIRSTLRQAATVLGASPRQVIQAIDLPIVSRAALVGAGFSFAISMGEFGATAFLARPDQPTLTTAIFRLLSRPGQASFGRAMALSVVLMIVTGTTVLVIDRFRVASLGEF